MSGEGRRSMHGVPRILSAEEVARGCCPAVTASSEPDAAAAASAAATAPAASAEEEEDASTVAGEGSLGLSPPSARWMSPVWGGWMAERRCIQG